MKYRADIDGLRAIAVLMVLFYHAHFSAVASGFIGVDIFFVISGFLIANILLQELKQSADQGKIQFRFIHFYKKRLWRLMPVFIVVLIVVTLSSTLFYLPDAFNYFIRSAKNSALFNANVYFARTTGGYFSPNINYLTLLHTWSLSLEWQFYAILPILLYGLYRLFPAHRLSFIIGWLTILLIGLSLYLSANMPDKNYYTLSARAFELMMGAYLATLPIQSFADKYPIPKWGLTVLGCISLMGLIYCAMSPNVLSGFPNYYAIGICFATVVLILIGQLNPHNLISRLLSIRPLVWIGLLSYSLYLWHWPIFATLRYLSITETLTTRLLCLLAAFIIGFISWYCLERPARRFNQTHALTTFLLLVILPAALMQSIALLSNANDGFPARFPYMSSINQQLKKYDQKGRKECINQPNQDLTPLCQLGAPIEHTQHINALMIGDSFANHFWGFMDILAQNANIRVQSNTMPGCLTLPNLYIRDSTNVDGVNTKCHEQTSKYYERIQSHKYDYVILGQRWSGYIDDRIIPNKANASDTPNAKASLNLLKKSLNQAIELIIASGARPVIFEESFLDPINGDNFCRLKSIKLYLFMPVENNLCTSPFIETKEAGIAKAIIHAAKVKYPSLIIIDPKIVQCPNHNCLSEINQIPIFKDQTHLNDYASYQFGKQYLQRVKNPFILNPN